MLGVNRGAIYLITLGSNLTVVSFVKISDISGGFTAVLSNYDLFGASVTSLPALDASLSTMSPSSAADSSNDSDVSGDDRVYESHYIGVGCYYDDDGGSARGAVYILSIHPLTHLVLSFLKISDLSGGFTGLLENTDSFGISIASLTTPEDSVGSENETGSVLNNPGMIVGASDDDDGGNARGAIYIIWWNLTSFINYDNPSNPSNPDMNSTGGNDNSSYSSPSSPSSPGSRRNVSYVSSFQKVSNSMGNFTAVFSDEAYFGYAVIYIP